MKHLAHVAHHAAVHHVAHHYAVPADYVHHLSHVAVVYLRAGLCALLALL